MEVDRNDLFFWFPPIEAAGLLVPRTRIVLTVVELSSLLDGETPSGYGEFIDLLRAAAREIGFPAFLRTGHGSAKHDWSRTCDLTDEESLEARVFALVEWSHLVDMWGLPTGTWAVRERIRTTPLFCCEGYQNFPVTREFRVFVRDDEVEHIQPYWPPGAVEEGRPDAPNWRDLLAEASKLEDGERDQLAFLAGMASSAVGGGYWSADFLQDRDGAWWLTDMALGEESFRWDPDEEET